MTLGTNHFEMRLEYHPLNRWEQKANQWRGSENGAWLAEVDLNICGGTHADA